MHINLTNFHEVNLAPPTILNLPPTVMFRIFSYATSNHLALQVSKHFRACALPCSTEDVKHIIQHYLFIFPDLKPPLGNESLLKLLKWLGDAETEITFEMSNNFVIKNGKYIPMGSDVKRLTSLVEAVKALPTRLNLFIEKIKKRDELVFRSSYDLNNQLIAPGRKIRFLPQALAR